MATKTGRVYFREDDGTADAKWMVNVFEGSHLVYVAERDSEQEARKHLKERLTPLTSTTLDLFLAYAKDAGNWGGNPLVGGNVGGDAKAQRGNLTQMKKAGLIETFEDHEPGQGKCTWIIFTDAGRALALAHGVTVSD